LIPSTAEDELTILVIGVASSNVDALNKFKHINKFKMIQKSKVIAATPRRTAKGNFYVLVLSKGEEILYTQEQINGILSGMAFDNNVQPELFNFKSLIGTQVTGDWDEVKKGEKLVLKADHPLVEKGATVPMSVIRNKKDVALAEGEKAQAGDTYVYPRDKTRLNGILNFELVDFGRVMSQIALKTAAAGFAAATGGTAFGAQPIATVPVVEEAIAESVA
jgi:hypothetical protein